MPTSANNEEQQELQEPQQPQQPPSPWKINRRFWFKQNASWTWGAFYRNELWVVEPFGRIRAMRRGARVQLSDERKRVLLDCGYLVWADEVKIQISAGLKTLIEQAPTASTVRACVRSEVGDLPAKENTPKTSEEWFKYIDSVPAPPPENLDLVAVEIVRMRRIAQEMAPMDVRLEAAAQPPPTPQPVGAEVAQPDHEEGYYVRVRAKRVKRGRCSFSGEEEYQGSILVPANVLAEGSTAAIERYIAGELEDGDYEFEETDDDYEHYDHETNETSAAMLQDHNIAPVLRTYQQEMGIIVQPPPQAAVTAETPTTGTGTPTTTPVIYTTGADGTRIYNVPPDFTGGNITDITDGTAFW